MRGQKEDAESLVGQVWEESYGDKNYVFLVIGEGTIMRLSGEEAPSYVLLDLETGEQDEVIQRALRLVAVDDGKWSWRRIA